MIIAGKKGLYSVFFKNEKESDLLIDTEKFCSCVVTACVCLCLSARVCIHSLVMLHLVTARSRSFKKKKKMRLVMGVEEQHHMSNVTLVTVRFSSAARVHAVWTRVHNLHKHTSWVMTEGSHLSREIRSKYI